MKRKINAIDIIVDTFIGIIILTICLCAIQEVENLCSKPIETTYEVCEITDVEHTKAINHRRGIPGKTIGSTYYSEEFNIYVEFADGNVHYFTVDQATYAKAKANPKVKIEKTIKKTPLFKNIVTDYEIVEFLK